MGSFQKFLNVMAESAFILILILILSILTFLTYGVNAGTLTFVLLICALGYAFIYYKKKI